MYYKSNALIIVLLLIFFSCTSKNDQTKKIDTTINFNSLSENNALDFFSISFLPLQTNDSCILGGINQIKEVDNKYIILDVVKTRKIMTFNKKGEFLGNIGNIGNAPGEYIRPISFSIDNNKNIIAVIDADRLKILYYSVDKYSFLYEEKIPFNTSHMEFLSNGEKIWNNKEEKNTNHDFILTDNNMKIKKGLLERIFFSPYSIGMTRNIYKQNNNISIYSPFDPTLYRIKNDTIFPIYHFSFGNYKTAPIAFLEEESKKNKKNHIPSLRKSPYIYHYNIFETNNWLCVPYYVDKKMFFGFYNKTNNTTYNYSQKFLENSLGVGAFSSPIGVTNDNCFISLLRPDLLKELKENGTKLNPSLDSIIEKINEEDNPVLLFLKGK